MAIRAMLPSQRVRGAVLTANLSEGGGLGECECMNAPAATAKRLFIVISAAGQENGLWGFSSASASNAPERASVLALSAAGQASLKPRPNQTDRLPDAPIRQFRRKAYVIQMEFVR